MNHTSARLFFHLRKSAAVPRSSAVSAVATLKCGHQPRLWSWEAKSLLALPQTLGRHRPFVSSIIAAQMSNGGHAATMERTSRWRGLRVCCATEARLMSSKSPANDGEAMDPKTWVDSMPTKVQPYLLLARLDKPIGTWLLLWPCAWSIAIAAPIGAFPDVGLMARFAVGAIVMRGAGCTINDMWDRDIDAKVARTRTRPLAAGTLTQMDALRFLGIQLTAGLAVLTSLNTYSIALGAASMGLVVIYPLMKRVTDWPQLVLGLCFNWGALLGASAVLGYCPWSTCVPMYFGSVAWTLCYDTIYAHQDKSDDVRIGVRSTALLLGDWTKPACAAWSALFVGGLALSGADVGLGAPFYASLLGASAHLGWQVWTVDLNNPKDCGAKFRSNRWIGLLLFAGIVFGKLTPPIV